MENRKFVSIIIALGVLMSTPSVAYGYAVSTHANLTEKTFAEYERIFGNTFTDEEIEHAKQGSREEDTFESKRRPLNHFYDPVNDIGLRAHGMLSIPNITRGLATPVWAVDTEAQANFLEERIGYTDTLFSSPTDFSWDRAVYEYVHGDKERAVKTLGHIIHLVQDATSPAHVRNDAHLMGDVYETFTNGMQPGDWHIAESNMPQDNSIQSIIKRTALFTNKNFLSGDTIFEGYDEPSRDNLELSRISRGNKSEYFGVDNKGVYLVRIKIKRDWLQNNVEETYFLKDENNQILTDYWETLSKRAVRDGVAAIRLFFQDVEKERETLALHDKNKSAAEEKFESAQATLFGIAKGLYGSSVDEESFEELNPDAADQGASVATAGTDGSADNEDAQQEEEQEPASADGRTESTSGETQSADGSGVATEEAGETENADVSDEEGGNEEQDTLNTTEGSGQDSETQNGEGSTEGDENGSDDNTNTEPSNSSGPFSEGIPIQGVGGGGSAASDESNENISEEENEPEEEGDSEQNDEQKEESEADNDQEKQDEANETEEADEPEEGDEDQDEEKEQEQPKEETDSTPPSAPIITTPDNPSRTFTNNQVTFAGTAEATSTININISNATTTADQNGDWSLTLAGLPQSTSTIQFFATDESGNTSAPATTTVFIDSTVAVPTLSVPACAQSLAQSTCLVATTTVVAQWTSQDDDVRNFIVDTGDGPATTTATSTRITVDNPDDLTVTVRAVDTAGNTSDPVSKNISVRSNPVVISEVAWMGTRASAFDEWIELYNPTDADIDLSGWTLHAGDGSPYIPLSGSISAGGYYLIERTDDNALASTTADLVVPFSGLDESTGLSNSGERLALVRYTDNTNATTTIDETPNCDDWCGGGNKDRYRTMERYDVHAHGADRDNWGTALGEFIENGKDVDGNDINGTPGTRNSISYQITNGTTLTEDKTLTNKHPYIIGRNGFTIDEGATLTLEEGVVVKLVSANEPSLVVDGTLNTNGTKAEPVVFTAFTDDTYGGDMNGDGDASAPWPGAWKKILFADTSEGSSLTHTKIRYGGRWFRNTDMRAAVAVDNTGVSFDYVTIAHPKRNGLYLRVSSSTIAHSTFKHATSSSASAGVRVGGGAPQITNSTFAENEYGMRIASAPNAEIQNNTFIDNETEAVYAYGPVPHMSGNGGLGNAVNAITIGHNRDIAEPKSTTTLYANDLPYLVVDKAEVSNGAALTFGSGAVIKGHTDSSNDLGTITVKDGGRMVYDGTKPTDVIFTSMHDDVAGGAVYDSAQQPEPGDWEGIVVEDGGQFSLSGFTLRYAGHERGRSPADGLRIETGSGTTTIAHAIIEYNKEFGVLAKEDAALKVLDTEIRNHPKNTDIAYGRIGLLIQNSTAALTDASFSNNELDIKAQKGATAMCSGCGAPSTDPEDLLD